MFITDVLEFALLKQQYLLKMPMIFEMACWAKHPQEWTICP
jgi:hypothetical protein